MDCGVFTWEALAGKGLVNRDALCAGELWYYQLVHLGVEKRADTWRREKERDSAKILRGWEVTPIDSLVTAVVTVGQNLDQLFPGMWLLTTPLTALYISSWLLTIQTNNVQLQMRLWCLLEWPPSLPPPSLPFRDSYGIVTSHRDSSSNSWWTKLGTT